MVPQKYNSVCTLRYLKQTKKKCINVTARKTQRLAPLMHESNSAQHLDHSANDCRL